jgi:serine/threonine-protein kinase
VCLYQLLSTKLPFEAPSIAELCLKVLSQDAVPLRSVRQEVPIGLETIVHKCLARERVDRYQNVAALAGDLETYADVTGKLSAQRVKSVVRPSVISLSGADAGPPSHPDALPTQAVPDGSTQGAWGTSSAPKRKPTLGILLVMTLFLVLGVAGALFFFRPKHDPVQNTAVPPSISPSAAVTASDTAPVIASLTPTALPTASAITSASAKPIRPGVKPPASAKPGASVSPDQLLMDRN